MPAGSQIVNKSLRHIVQMWANISLEETINFQYLALFRHQIHLYDDAIRVALEEIWRVAGDDDVGPFFK